jgi:hypothetical protein
MFNDLGHPIGEDFSHSNGKNSHFHDAPLESVTPLLDIFWLLTPAASYAPDQLAP